MNSALQVRKLHPMLGVEAEGIAINREIPPHLRANLLSLVETHGLVLLRGQELGEEILGSFARSLGPIWTFSFVTKNKSGLHVATNDVYRYTNRTTDGNLVQDDHPTMITIKVNQIWHSDSTYTRPGS